VCPQASDTELYLAIIALYNCKTISICSFVPMECPETRVPVRASLFLTSLLLLFCVCDTHQVPGEHKNQGLLSIDSATCNGSNPCFPKLQLPDPFTSFEQKYRGTNVTIVTLQTAEGLVPNDPCPATEPLNSGANSHSVAKQVS
jgi:hypothetical protein